LGLSRSREGKYHRQEIKVSLGCDLARSAGWIHGDRVTIGFKRVEKIMGIQRTNIASGALKLRRANNRVGSGPDRQSITVAFSIQRVPDDLRDGVVAWIGHAGRVIEAPMRNADTIYWFMDASESSAG
jgi:hypothetical protein